MIRSLLLATVLLAPGAADDELLTTVGFWRRAQTSAEGVTHLTPIDLAERRVRVVSALFHWGAGPRRGVHVSWTSGGRALLSSPDGYPYEILINGWPVPGNGIVPLPRAPVWPYGVYERAAFPVGVPFRYWGAQYFPWGGWLLHPGEVVGDWPVPLDILPVFPELQHRLEFFNRGRAASIALTNQGWLDSPSADELVDPSVVTGIEIYPVEEAIPAELRAVRGMKRGPMMVIWTRMTARGAARAARAD